MLYEPKIRVTGSFRKLLHILLVEEPVFKNVKNKHLGMPPF